MADFTASNPANTKLLASLANNSLFQRIKARWGCSSGNSLDLHSPTTQQLIIKLALDSCDDITAKIGVIDGAMEHWSAMTGKERAELIKKFELAIAKNRQELAELLSAETGKPVAEGFGEVGAGMAMCDWFAAEAKRHYGQVIPSGQRNHKWFTQKHPIGPCSLVTPWNFPVAMVTRKALPALAAGCTVILRPASQTPLSALAHKLVAEDVGFPDGVFQITMCASRDTSPLFTDPRIKAISFTGSTPVGKTIMKQAADSCKKYCMELGGLAPFIVFKSANVNAAVEGLISGKFRNMGQVCISPNRVFVHADIHDQFVARLIQRMKERLFFGPPEDKTTTLGPMINRKGVESMARIVADAKSKGATIALGGKERPDLGPYFYEPTVLLGATLEMEAWSHETFGPIFPIGSFTDEAEVIKTANAGWHGLAAYFYSNDANECWRVANQIETGMLGINEVGISTVECPFGGTRESGIGREGGSHGIESYLQTKYINWNYSS